MVETIYISDDLTWIHFSWSTRIILPDWRKTRRKRGAGGNQKRTR